MRRIQHSLLRAYGLVRRTGILDTKVGRRAFEGAYWAYKTLLEARDLRTLKPYVTAGSTAIDVGANVGYFTTAFAQWVGPEGTVISIEPEELNFASLRKQVERRGLTERVSFVRAAAMDKDGMVRLALNPDHPADHHVADEGVPVRAVTVDAMAAERNWPLVSFIKIDVQGSELKVLTGAGQTLSRFHPALFVEFHEQSLVAAGTSSSELLTFLVARQYLPHVRRGSAWVRVSGAEVAAHMAIREYVDLLFLYAGAPLELINKDHRGEPRAAFQR